MPRSAILAALRRRDETGEGAHIDMALLDTQVGVLANQAMNYLVSGSFADAYGQRPSEHRSLSGVPAVRWPHHHRGRQRRTVREACRGSRRSRAASDSRFAKNADRVAYRDELAAILSGLTSKWVRGELLLALEREGVPAGPINSVADVFADPQVTAREMRIDVAVSNAMAGSVPGVRSPIVIDGEPAVAARPAPALGADTVDILADPNWGGRG